MNLNTQIITKVFVALCFIFLTSAVFAQKESVIYIGTNGKLTTLDKAIYMQKITTKSAGDVILTYSLKDSKWEKISSESYKKKNDSTFQIKGSGKNIPKIAFRTFHQQPDKSWKFKNIVKDVVFMTGSAKSVMPLLLDGQVIEFYSDGKKKSVTEYKDNELVSNENWDENGDKYIDNIFYSVDKDPTFNPGKKVLQDHILNGYKNAGIDISALNGSIIIGFVVMEDGSINGIKIIKGLGPNINTVTYELFSNLKGTWAPAKLNNQAVRYFQVFPINFINNQKSFQYAELGKGGINWGF